MKRWLLRILAGLLALAVLVVAAAWWWLRGSLPMLEGELRVTGLSAPARIERDALGVPMLHGESRNDIAFALGFLHAQERFFQMDLARRNAAGELSALFGAAALEHDRQARVHRFRWRAGRNLEAATPGARALLDAYTQGVNSGLAALARPPFEYTLFGARPERWRAEDCLLVIFSMFLLLQDDGADYERGLGLMAEVLPPGLFAFYARQGGRWDAPLTGGPLPDVPVPDLALPPLPAGGAPLGHHPLDDDDLLPGSNNWAVAGSLTAHGAALVANDMHLPLALPNTWYRAAWWQPDTGRVVAGVTLPGVPQMVAGSNGKVAWGFTNTQGDWSDVVILETDAQGARYRTADGWEPFEVVSESIAVRGAAPVEHLVLGTRWGPVIGNDHLGRMLALRWIAHDREVLGMGGVRMETVDSAAEAIALGPVYGIPQQNLVAGDDSGAIGWTIAGAIPRRAGLDGVLPQRWDAPGVGWDGVLDATDHPRLLDPPGQRLWTANARVAAGEALRRVGMQGAALGARQQQIRDALMARDAFDEQAMLDLQLDDRALFLARWRERLLAVLERAGPRADFDAARAKVAGWSGRAAVDDAGYLLVREFRRRASELALAPLARLLEAHDPEFRLAQVGRQMEYPAWDLLAARPAQLLDPAFASWDALELAALEQVLAPRWADGTLDDDTWGEANRLQVRHPLAGALPLLHWWLSLPDTPMPGDTWMPRVQSPRFGASERFAVAPGHEQDAYLHQPTGQSAHPLSPFFNAGHGDWLHGRPSPLLPGPAAHTLNLVPR